MPKLTLLVALLAAAALLGGSGSVGAGPHHHEVQRPGDVFLVCNRHRCRWEPGTGHRFWRLFGPARAVTEQRHGGAFDGWRGIRR